MVNLTTNQRKNLVIAAATVLVIGFSTWISLDSKQYFFYDDEDRAQWEHPTGHFLIFCGFYLLEALFLAKVIKLGARLWPRILLAAVLFLPWAAFSSFFALHAPGYMMVHILWTWLISAVLVLIFVGSAVRHLFNSFRGSQGGV
ncbi:hypothetical protein ASE35_14060 [Lysobacter sp. Root916]|uniref:hypothetical protein n=1 Tax=Lysobacter sp. Root916 TaxID=1736606 RepID=UPI0007143574|nr:hypothetical protein [Lysobacter sp. Root916]KRD32072.1 hypothetical protein ASE35_14060 [Lysobacter sp. Root916]